MLPKFVLAGFASMVPFLFASGVAASAAGPGGDSDRAVSPPSIFAVQSRLSTPNFQLFLGIEESGSVPVSGPLFGPAGGVYGADFLGETLYGAELENGGADEYLVTIPHEGATIGQGSRVSDDPIGFANVEALAVAEGTIFATSLDFAGHKTRLLTVNAFTGVGGLVGEGFRNVMLVGLAWDARAGILYGAATPFGGMEPDAVDVATLYRVDRFTGATTAIGPFGANIQSLTWHPTLGLLGAYEKLYRIDTSTGAATQLGSADFTDGHPGSFNGIYAMGAPIPEGALVCGDANGNGTINAVDALIVLRTAVGSASCSNAVCDVNGNGVINAVDALAVLRRSVGQPIELNCVS